MGMDLSGAGGIERFNHPTWGKILELAREYGWKPQGTQPARFYDENGELIRELSSDPAEWDGTYLSNDHQRVTDEDAANIAEALERALDDIPDFETDSETDSKWVRYGPDDPPMSLTSSPVERSLWEQEFVVDLPDGSLRPVEFFSGEGKQRVRDFIGYCRAGGFRID